MTAFILKRVDQLNSENAVFAMQGFIGTAAANATTNLEWQLPQERWITGGNFIVEKPHWGDKASLHIVYKDGLGGETVVNTFVTDAYMHSDTQDQLDISVPYVSLVPAGLYVRVAYTNTHATEATGIALNLYSHIPEDAV